MEYFQDYPQQSSLPTFSEPWTTSNGDAPQSFNDYSQLLPLPSHNDLYPASQEVQHYGNTATFHHGDFTTSQISLPLDQDPATAALQLDQLPIAEETNIVPLQPMAPPPKPRKPKAPTLRLDKWEPVKARIIELHISQNLPLPKVKEIVEEEFKSSGFTAT